MTAAEIQPFIQRCLACGTPFNALAGHSVRVCAAALTDHRKAA